MIDALNIFFDVCISGASQSVHTAAIHLAELGKAVLALHLFLTYRSGVINSSLIRGVRQEGNQLVYLNRLSFVFHRCLVESVAEWNQLIDKMKKMPDFAEPDDIVTSSRILHSSPVLKFS